MELKVNIFFPFTSSHFSYNGAPLIANQSHHIQRRNKQTGLQVFSSVRCQLHEGLQGEAGPSRGTSETLGMAAVLETFATKHPPEPRALWSTAIHEANGLIQCPSKCKINFAKQISALRLKEVTAKLFQRNNVYRSRLTPFSPLKLQPLRVSISQSRIRFWLILNYCITEPLTRCGKQVEKLLVANK